MQATVLQGLHPIQPCGTDRRPSLAASLSRPGRPAQRVTIGQVANGQFSDAFRTVQPQAQSPGHARRGANQHNRAPHGLRNERLPNQGRFATLHELPALRRRSTGRTRPWFSASVQHLSPVRHDVAARAVDGTQRLGIAARAWGPVLTTKNGRSALDRPEWAARDSNPGPPQCECGALTN